MKVKKKWGVKLGTAALSLVVVLSLSNVAVAYELTGAKWAKSLVSKLKYNRTGSSSVNGIWNDAIYTWNQQSTVPRFNSETSSSPNVEFQGVHLSNTDSDGKAQWYTDSSGTTYYAYAWINSYYTQNYSNEKARSVASHEIGHVLGLSHEKGCVLMVDNTADRYDSCKIVGPQSDDLNGINALY